MPELKPTDVGGCPLRLADFSTLTEALEYAALSRAGFNFYSARGELLCVLPYRDLRDQAASLARRMLRAGLRAGERVALIAETGPDFMRAFFASQYAGLVPVPVPTPAAFAGRAGYIDHIRPMLASARPSAVLAPDVFLDSVREAAAGVEADLVGTFGELERIPEDGADLPSVKQDDLCYLQFSSGSTRSPTGVAVTHRALLANARGILRDGVKVTAGDRCTSWLPFYHDMGLVGCILVPLSSQLSADYVPPDGFARRPLIWPILISQNGGTLSYSPSFGYDLCARRAMRASTEHLDLSRWRAAGVGGDVIRPRILSRFADTFSGCGFRKEAFVASYGMAEATLGISFAPLDRGIEVDRVDLGRMRQEGRASPPNGNGNGNGSGDGDGVRELVLCGLVLPGHEVEIRGADGTVLQEREVGRIMVRGPSVMIGYFGRREETARVLSSDGWLETGDLGYLVGESLVVAGRSKDLILVNGRNVWPEDLESAVEHQVDGIRHGDVVAFSVDGQEAERVVLLVQCRTSDAAPREALRNAVAEVVLATAGFNCAVVLVSNNALPRTSSGKLSRMRARQMYLSSILGESQPHVARVAPDSAPESHMPVSS